MHLLKRQNSLQHSESAKQSWLVVVQPGGVSVGVGVGSGRFLVHGTGSNLPAGGRTAGWGIAVALDMAKPRRRRIIASRGDSDA